MRKGHGSSKVPGVKLRPAGPQKAASESEQPLRLNTPDDFDVSDILKSSKKPFSGVVISASSIADKATLFQQAVQLGAQTSSDLTDRVTHLICNGTGTAKYIYCVQHGIPIVRPSWIEDSHKKYLEGEIVDVQASVDAHRLPTFTSIRLCLTAVEEEKRLDIEDLLIKNGGTFLHNIERNTTMTHLLCGGERGANVDSRGWTSKMQYVEKLAKNIKLVWEEWFWDCLEFKGLLNENDYSVSKPRPKRREQRSSTPLVQPISSNVDSSRQRIIPPSIPSASLLSPADAEEMASVKRMPETTSILWKGLLKNRGIDVDKGKIKRSPSKAASNTAKKSTSRPSLSNPVDQGSHEAGAGCSGQASSLTAAFRRAKSFTTKSVEQSENDLRTLQRIRSTPAASTISEAGPSSLTSVSPPSISPEQIPEGEKTLFFGMKFRLLADANDSKVAEAIKLRGGTVRDEDEEDVDFRIVRLASGSSIYRNEIKESRKLTYRTECWIEQCIYEERLCARDEHPAFKPLDIATPIAGSNGLKIHVSGLTAAEKTPSIRLIKSIGAIVTEHLSRKNTHLICPSGSGPKYLKAQEWRIPVVNLEWLYEVVRSGEIQNVVDFLVTPIPSENPTTSRVMDVGTITDITNEFVQETMKGKAPVATRSSSSIPVTQSSATESDSSLSWKTNGLLSNTLDAPQTTSPPISPRKPTLANTKTRPTTPSPRKRSLSEENQPISSPFMKSARLAKVPSSVTPSPLKMPSEATGSPSTLSGESANVLKEAISSLLGKRNSSDDVEPDVPKPKSGKRSKPPPRSKSKQSSFSRTTSSDKLSRTTSAYSEYPLYVPDDSKPPTTSYDESMRVTYEDPSQENEQRRLMSLINNEPVEPEKPTGGRKGRNAGNSGRRSSRAAGF